MNRALRTAATGMFAQQVNIDLISNNLANVNTTGFKKSRPEFQDLMYQTIKTNGIAEDGKTTEVAEIQIGNGAVPVATTKNFRQGDMTPTSNPLDMAIQGEGFFQVRRSDGTTAYSRDGSLKISADGQLVTSQGYTVEPGITFSSSTADISISRDGTVEVMEAGQTSQFKLGQLELAKFINPAGLHAIGSNLYLETGSSGQPIIGAPGSEGFGEIAQGTLESSNVDVVEEMISMIVAQRAYEINSKTIKTVEEMLGMANNLKQG
ncbi:MAG: flagellar basal-body rod protein FlgG [Bacteroidetes bacterium]|nr:flagellar basal-body rod protein FlgG [Bacteroidota bacterium]